MEEKTVLTITLMNNSKKKLSVDSSTKIGALCDNIAEKVGVKMKWFFSLCEIIQDENGAEMDKFLQHDKTVAEEGITAESKLVYKVKLLKTPVADSVDPLTIDLLFRQVNLNVIQEVYPCPEKVAVQLAALQIQAQFGDYNPKKHRVGYLNKVGLNAYLPKTVSRHDYMYWQERFFRLHQRLNGLSMVEAEKKYLAVAQEKIPFYGMTFFEMKDSVGLELLVGVAEDGVCLFKSSNMAILYTIPFSVLLEWKVVENGLELHYEDVGEEEILKLQTTEKKATQVVSLLDDYFALILPETAKNPKAISSNNTRNDLKTKKNLFKPIGQRVFLGRFSSRLEYLKAFYMEMCNVYEITPITKFCKQIDAAIDDEDILKSIDVSDSQITSDNLSTVFKSISKTLTFKYDDTFPWQENFSLKELNISGNKIHFGTSKSFSKLFESVKSLKRINFSDVIIEEPNIPELASILQQQINLKCIELRNCGLTTKHINDICGVLEGLPKLKKIDFSNGDIDDKGLCLLTRVIAKCELFEELIFRNNAITAKGLKQFAKSLETCPKNKIKKLDFSDNKKCIDPLDAISEFIDQCKFIVNMEMCGLKITGGFFETFLSAPKSKHLNTLNLSRNSLGSSGTIPQSILTKFCDSVNAHQNLKFLNLSSNGFGGNFGKSVATGFQNNEKLIELNLSNNPLFSSSSNLDLEWVEFLKYAYLQKIDLSFCGISQKVAGLILNALSDNENIVELDLSGNVDVCEVFAQINYEIRLKSLSLNNCGIADSHFLNLLKILKKTPNLKNLEMRDNQVTKAGISTLIQDYSKLNLKIDLRKNNVSADEEKDIYALWRHCNSEFDLIFCE